MTKSEMERLLEKGKPVTFSPEEMRQINAANERREKRRAAWREMFEASEEMREELQARAAIDDLRVTAEMTPMEAFRSHAMPPRRLSRRWYPGAPVDPFGEEVVAATWDEMAGKSLADLMTLQDALRGIVDRFESEAEEHFEKVEASTRKSATEDETRDYMTWYRSLIMQPHIDQHLEPYVPAVWSRTSAALRSVYVRRRAEIRRIEDSAEAARFRLQICEHVITRIALLGAASTWEGTPEDERPRFEEEKKRGYGLLPDVQRWIIDQMTEETKSRSIEEADAIVVKRLKEVHGIERKPGIARHYFYK